VRSTQLQLAVDLKAAEGRLLMMLKELTLLKVTSKSTPVDHALYAQHYMQPLAVAFYV